MKDLEKNLELSGSSFQRELQLKKKKVLEAQDKNRALQEELLQLNQKLKVSCEAVQAGTYVLVFYLWKNLSSSLHILAVDALSDNVLDYIRGVLFLFQIEKFRALTLQPILSCSVSMLLLALVKKSKIKYIAKNGY